MHLNTAILDAMLPITHDLAAGLPVSNERWQALSALTPVLDHGGVTVAQWRSIWETATRGESPALPMRQQLIWNAARTALTRLEQVRQVAGLLTPALLADQIASRVMACLPPGAGPGAELHLVLGTCSGGFVGEDGAMYVDLATVPAAPMNGRAAQRLGVGPIGNGRSSLWATPTPWRQTWPTAWPSSGQL